MKLLFKQRFLSWFDSYDIYDENGDVVFIVKGELSWGKRLKVFDAHENYLGEVKQELFTFFPKFEIFIGNAYAGEITKRFSLFSHEFDIDYLGWYIEGDFLGWDYSVMNQSGAEIAKISKEILNFSDTYCIDFANEDDALHVLMLVIVIDAEKAA